MKHARDSLRDRALQQAWAEAAIRTPDWVEPDPNDAAVERRFKAIAEADGRVIRVPCVETADEIRALTVLLDRGAGAFSDECETVIGSKNAPNF